jgi:hypothetical protein
MAKCNMTTSRSTRGKGDEKRTRGSGGSQGGGGALREREEAAAQQQGQHDNHITNP